MDIKKIIDQGYEIGMHQHREEFENFINWVVSRGPIENVIEIGMLHGGTTSVFHEISTGKVLSIDLPDGPFGGKDHNLNEIRCVERGQRLKARFSRLHVLNRDSRHFMTIHHASRLFDKEPVDLLFIDGDHDYESVMSDYLAYSQIVVPGGIIAFHDINITKFHEDAGVHVPVFWQMLRGDKHEFTVNKDWGGIGALIKSQEL